MLTLALLVLLIALLSGSAHLLVIGGLLALLAYSPTAFVVLLLVAGVAALFF